MTSAAGRGALGSARRHAARRGPAPALIVAVALAAAGAPSRSSVCRWPVQLPADDPLSAVRRASASPTAVVAAGPARPPAVPGRPRHGQRLLGRGRPHHRPLPRAAGLAAGRHAASAPGSPGCCCPARRPPTAARGRIAHLAAVARRSASWPPAPGRARVVGDVRLGAGPGGRAGRRRADLPRWSTLGLAVVTLRLHATAAAAHDRCRARCTASCRCSSATCWSASSWSARRPRPALAAVAAAGAVAPAADLPPPAARRGGAAHLAGVRRRPPRALNRLDEREVAAAGVRGALTSFGARAGRARRPARRRRRRRYPATRRAPVDNAVHGRAPRLPTNRSTRTLAVGADAGRRAARCGCPRRPCPAARDERRGRRVRRRARRRAARRRHPPASCGSSSGAAAYEAVHDPLTGLANRAALLAQGDAVLRAARPRARRWPCCCSTSTGSARSTARSATRPATSCCRLLADRLADLARDGELLGPARRRRVRAAAHPASRAAAGDRDRRREDAQPAVLRRARDARRAAGRADRGGRRPAVGRGRRSAWWSPAAGTADMAELLRRADSP